MVSPTDICNIALTWLSADTISDIGGNGTTNKICRANYDASRKIVLEDAEWTFAIERVQLNLLAGPPPFGFKNQFALPINFLRSINAYDRVVRNAPTIIHVIEGNKLLTDREEVYLRYMFDLTDSNKFSGYFVHALAAQLASNIAMPLTANAELQMSMLTVYADKLERGATSDGLQGSREFLERSTMENSRRHFVRVD